MKYIKTYENLLKGKSKEQIKNLSYEITYSFNKFLNCLMIGDGNSEIMLTIDDLDYILSFLKNPKSYADNKYIELEYYDDLLSIAIMIQRMKIYFNEQNIKQLKEMIDYYHDKLEHNDNKTHYNVIKL